MILISLFIFSSMLWQETFTDTTLTMSQLYDYSIDISQKEGKVFLKANPESEGFAAVWFYVDEDIAFSSDDILKLVIKVNTNKVRFRYLYRREGRKVYFRGEEVISPDEQWQRVKIPLGEAKPIYSSNYPYALTPDKNPCLFIFIDNELPGYFDVEIDSIYVFRTESQGEEK